MTSAFLKIQIEIFWNSFFYCKIQLILIFKKLTFFQYRKLREKELPRF